MAKNRMVSVAELEQALSSGDGAVRYNAMFDFAKGAVTTDAIAVLRRGLRDAEPGVVRYAAEGLGKLGAGATTVKAGEAEPAVPTVVWELMEAGQRIDPATLAPQSYVHCLNALVAIGANDWAIELVHNCIGINNWHPLKASLEALAAIGTPEANDLLERAVVFWRPELDKKQKEIVERLLPGKGGKKAAGKK
jgi:HEAT repeat protein